jgi:hypothetical protein
MLLLIPAKLGIGLGAAILLFLLAIPYWITSAYGADIGNPGLLHIIWWFRQHHELEASLVQVSHPTDQNLRAAGLAKTQISNVDIDMQVPQHDTITKTFGRSHGLDQEYNKSGLSFPSLLPQSMKK